MPARRREFTEAEEQQIIAEREAGETVAVIGRRYDVGSERIYDVIRARAPHLIQRRHFPRREPREVPVPRPVAVPSAPERRVTASVAAESGVIRYQPTREQLMAGSARVRPGLVY